MNRLAEHPVWMAYASALLVLAVMVAGLVAAFVWGQS